MIVPMVGHKTCLSKVEKTEIMQSIFSSHSARKLKNNRKCGDFQGLVVNNPPAKIGDMGSNPGLGTAHVPGSD